jgi:hypothetical protein
MKGITIFIAISMVNAGRDSPKAPRSFRSLSRSVMLRVPGASAPLDSACSSSIVGVRSRMSRSAAGREPWRYTGRDWTRESVRSTPCIITALRALPALLPVAPATPESAVRLP